MEREQERKLADWLGAYRVADADPALLDQIVAMAAATPQRTEPAAPRLWGAYAAAFTAAAMIGFWSGAVSAPEPVKALSSQQSSLSGKSYLNNVIFGPKTWKEVSL